MDRKLLDILACPSTRQPLSLLEARGLDALNHAIAGGGIRRIDDTPQVDPIPAALVTRDRKLAYRIDDGIPVLLVEEAIALGQVPDFPPRELPGASSERRRSSTRPAAGTDVQTIHSDVVRALAEDLGSGDVTASLLTDHADSAYLLCKEDAVICGRPWFDACHSALDPQVRIDWRVDEGQRVAAGTILALLQGRTRALVSAERTALNFLQTLSGTATTTAAYVDAIRGTGARILDTRKTIPGLRLAQKYAVRAGGGSNHRVGLFDAVMLKENHVRAAGSIAAAIAAARRMHPALPLIVEVETLLELEQALAAECDRILIDDFDAPMRREAVRIAAAAPYNRSIPLEASGGVDLAGLRAIAEDGVDSSRSAHSPNMCARSTCP